MLSASSAESLLAFPQCAGVFGLPPEMYVKSSGISPVRWGIRVTARDVREILRHFPSALGYSVTDCIIFLPCVEGFPGSDLTHFEVG